MIAVPWAVYAAGAVALAASQAGGWAATQLAPAGGARVLVPHALALTVVHNPGIAFGLLARLSPGATIGLALTVLAAELYNILAFHLTLSPGIGPALVACVLWVLVFLQYRNSFSGVLAAKPVVQE